MIDSCLNDFLSEIVESRGLRIALLEETAAGGMRVDVRDPDVGPLFGTWQLNFSSDMSVDDALDALERACDHITAWDVGPVPIHLDASAYVAMRDAA